MKTQCDLCPEHAVSFCEIAVTLPHRSQPLIFACCSDCALTKLGFLSDSMAEPVSDVLSGKLEPKEPESEPE